MMYLWPLLYMPMTWTDIYHSKDTNDGDYRNVSYIRRTKWQNLNDSRLVLQLSVPNPLMPSVKSILKM